MSVIGDSHLEMLGDRDGVLRAKGEIFEGMQSDDLAILNGDDAHLKNFFPPVRRITYGMNPGNDFVAENVENLGVDGIRCTIRHDGRAFEAHIPAFGVHMVYAALAGAAVGASLGMTDEEIAAGIAKYQTVGERARVIRTDRLNILSDCYNANPSSTAAAIESLMLLPGRRVCILGDMLELGENTAALHAQVGERAAKCGVDLVLACGELSRNTYEGAKRCGANAEWFESKAKLLECIHQRIAPGDSVLVKASHSCAFEEVTEVLKNL
jgi:UDP-N-acetylmuramoyl-tripeptide--D-alanyl-D-alanine ligase